jgi:predicted nucleic acid-binding Zn ribbon protein
MRMSDPDPTACPECGQATLTKAMSAPSFRLAGSGWYETDFKKDGDKKRNLVEGSSGENKAADGKPADAKSAESKPADSKPAAGKSESASAPATSPAPSPPSSSE